MLDRILELDYSLFYLINSQWTAAWADQFFPLITDLHKTPYFRLIVIPILFGIYIWRRGVKKAFIMFFFCLASLGLSDGIGTHAFKKTIERPRPGDTAGLEVQVRSPYGGYSFVSNHASNMFGFASFNAFMFPQAAVPLYALASLIGYSRIYNGVHFPTDVLCGALLGILCGYLMSLSCKWVFWKIDQKKAGSS